MTDDHSRRIVVFGAGASHGARTPSPPLGAHLHRYVLKYLCAAWDELGCLEEGAGFPTDRIRHELRAGLDKTQSFETLVTQLIHARRRSLLKKLNVLMAYALTPPLNDDPRADGAFGEGCDVYDRFLAVTARSQQGLEGTTFVTFNYDCLLERAICRCLGTREQLQGEGQCLCKHANYQLTDNSAGVEVLKPHGSINWIADVLLGDGSIGEGQEIPVVATLVSGDVFEWKEIRAVVSPIGQGHDEIAIAHYAPEKRPQMNPRTLLKIRNLARARIEEAGFITIIGLHLPADPEEDPFLSELLKAMKRVRETGQAHVDYISPDPSQTEKARSTFGFNAVQKTFEKYVAQYEDQSESDKRRTPCVLI